MFLRSFRLRLVLISVTLSGIVLLSFAALAMSVIRRIGIERIDRELQALVDVHIRRHQPAEHWARFDESLATIYGQQGDNPFVVKVADRRGAPLYVSAGWPAGLSDARLPALEPVPEPLDPPRSPPPDEGVAPPRTPAPFDGEPPRPGPFDGPPQRPPRPMHQRGPVYVTAEAADASWRLAAMGNEEVTLTIGMDLGGFYGEIRRFRDALAVAVPIAMLLLGAGGWFLAGQALRPVKVLTTVAGGITAKGLDQRVPAMPADREFQILQGRLEQAVQSAPLGSAAQRDSAELLEEVQRLKTIVQKLLLLAQADSGQLKLSVQRVDISTEVDALCQDVQALAPGLTLRTDIAPGVCVMSDPDLIRQALQNLTGNAIKHNRDGGEIVVTVRRQDARATVTISNTTEAALHLDRDRIFERFYRGDKARGRDVDGVGLGLSLAREIARAHQGDLELQELRKGWISFALWLPSP